MPPRPVRSGRIRPLIASGAAHTASGALLASLHQSEVGAVVGAQVGPGLLGAVVHRR